LGAELLAKVELIFSYRQLNAWLAI